MNVKIVSQGYFSPCFICTFTLNQRTIMCYQITEKYLLSIIGNICRASLESLLSASLSHKKCNPIFFIYSGILTVEEIFQDRKKFAQMVCEVASPDVIKMGIDIVSFTIKEVNDDVTYLGSLGNTQTAIVKRDATVGVAEANRDAGIRVSASANNCFLCLIGLNHHTYGMRELHKHLIILTQTKVTTVCCYCLSTLLFCVIDGLETYL